MNNMFHWEKNTGNDVPKKTETDTLANQKQLNRNDVILAGSLSFVYDPKVRGKGVSCISKRGNVHRGNNQTSLKTSQFVSIITWILKNVVSRLGWQRNH